MTTRDTIYDTSNIIVAVGTIADNIEDCTYAGTDHYHYGTTQFDPT